MLCKECKKEMIKMLEDYFSLDMHLRDPYVMFFKFFNNNYQVLLNKNCHSILESLLAEIFLNLKEREAKE